jgi:hypothetical protein
MRQTDAIAGGDLLHTRLPVEGGTSSTTQRQRHDTGAEGLEDPAGSSSSSAAAITGGGERGRGPVVVV